MIAHHVRALAWSQAERMLGANPAVLTMAESIIATEAASSTR